MKSQTTRTMAKGLSFREDVVEKEVHLMIGTSPGATMIETDRLEGGRIETTIEGMIEIIDVETTETGTETIEMTEAGVLKEMTKEEIETGPITDDHAPVASLLPRNAKLRKREEL